MSPGRAGAQEVISLENRVLGFRVVPNPMGGYYQYLMRDKYLGCTEAAYMFNMRSGEQDCWERLLQK
jgi:hypothetical protein